MAEADRPSMGGETQGEGAEPLNDDDQHGPMPLPQVHQEGNVEGTGNINNVVSSGALTINQGHTYKTIYNYYTSNEPGSGVFPNKANGQTMTAITEMEMEEPSGFDEMWEEFKRRGEIDLDGHGILEQLERALQSTEGTRHLEMMKEFLEKMKSEATGTTESIQDSDNAEAFIQSLLSNLDWKNLLGDTTSLLTSERVADNPEEVNRLKAFIEKKAKDGDTQLIMASYMGHASMVNFLLVKGAKTETKDANNRTPLTIASYKGHTQVVELLLQYKADIETKDKKGFFPLFNAAQEGHVRVVRLLLNKGAKTETKSASGSTALTVACAKGNCNVVQLLLERGADTEPKDSDGDTPLAITCAIGHTSIVEVLLNSGASTEPNDDKGFFPLYIAAQQGYEQIVRMLLKHEANVRKTIPHGPTALTVASLKGRTSVVKLLLEAKADPEVRDSEGHTPLAAACITGNTDVAELLLKNGADIETRDSGSNTPLCIASLRGMTAICALLLKYRADVKATNKKGFFPLYNASQEGHEPIARMLLKRGAKTGTQIPSGCTSLHIACVNGNTEVVKLLLKYNADTETSDSDGNTPLCISSLRGMTDIVALLLDAGSNVETRNNRAFFPLYNAAQNGHEQIVRLLLNNGACTETSLESGFTPLCIASHQGHIGTVRLLLDHGANSEAKDKQGRNPLVIAEGQGHQEVVDLLYDSKVGVNTLLLNASEKGNEHGASSSLTNGADIETKDASGNTALCIASFKGHYGVVSCCLLKRGAKTEATNNDGHFPLFVAAKNNHPRVTHCLLKNGATIDDHDASPLHVSSQCGHEIVVVTLLLSKANIERKDRAGRSPLVSAAMYGQTDVVGTLIKHGADCESRDNAGLSALDISVIHGQVDTVEYFMKRITDEKTVRSVAEQMVSLSAEYGQKRVISFLAEFIPKLNLNHRDTSGLSPLAKAVSCSQFECVRILHSLGATLTANELRYCRSADIYEYFLLAGLYNTSSDLEDIKLQQYLPFTNEVDWRVFEATLSPSGPKEGSKKKLALFVDTKGVGSVRNLDDKTRNELMQAIHDKVSNMTEIARKRWKVGPPKRVGSTAEESKVGFPDEIDFKLTRESVVSENDIEDVGHVFRRYTKQDLQSNSKLFHSEFWTDVPLIKDDTVISFPTAVTGDGSASTLMLMVWPSESALCRLAVSVDVVLSIRVDNCWPQGAVQKTWMMNREELKRIGYELVAKPPSKNSRFGERFPCPEREKLYTISFSNLDIEHIKELNPCVKDAFLLSKCMRNPVVCKVVVRDDGVIHFVDSYISTFFLKNIFLRNVEDFLQHKRNLIEMVYIIYSQLEYYLSHAFVPLFWMPSVNLIEGTSVNAVKSHKVAAHMKSLIRDAYVEELDHEPPNDVNDNIKIPQDCPKFDLSDASRIEILSVPLKEADIASLRR